MQHRSGQPASFLSVVSCGRSPDAWPIEVAWGFAAGEIRSMLLRPAGGWGLDAWDKGCEALHRIGLEALLEGGKSPLDACLILNAALGQSDVFVASPETDSLWLFKLYKAAGVEPNFKLNHLGQRPIVDATRAAAGVEVLRRQFKVAQSA